MGSQLIQIIRPPAMRSMADPQWQQVGWMVRYLTDSVYYHRSHHGRVDSSEMDVVEGGRGKFELYFKRPSNQQRRSEWNDSPPTVLEYVCTVCMSVFHVSSPMMLVCVSLVVLSPLPCCRSSSLLFFSSVTPFPFVEDFHLGLFCVF